MNRRMTHSRIVLVSVLTGVMAIASTSGGSAQDASSKDQKSELAPVKLSLIVTDPSGHSVDTLRKEDLQLLEDGVPQPITFLSKDDRPVDYGIAIDSTGSFRRVLQQAINAAEAIIKNNRAGDETFVERFVSSDKIEKIVEFTANKDRLFDGLDSIFVEGGRSAVVDAVYIAVEHISERRKETDDRRQALVLITDGEDRSSYYDLADLEKLLNEKDVQIFVIGFVSEVSANPTQEQRRQGYRTRDESVALISRMVEITGGRAFFPNGISELDRAVREIDRDLRNQYSIAYVPTERKQGFHKITVQITAVPEKEKLSVIARPGYFIASTEKPKDKKPK